MVRSAVPLDEICEVFEDLADRTEQIGYLVEIGQSLPEFPASQRTEANRVLGCQSMVWLVGSQAGGQLEFVADSDAPMVRGLVAILLAAYSGKTPAEILAFPVDDLFARLRLGSFLTPLRSNGLHSMVQRVLSIARQVEASSPPTAGASAVAKDKPAPAPAAQPALPPLDPLRYRGDFPILARTVHDGKPLVYLDNAASTQRPRAVLQAVQAADEKHYSNVHRGGHALAAESTIRYEAARRSVQKLLEAASEREIVFTSGATAAINLVARSWGDANLGQGDEILLSLMEHHSNIVPWQQLAQRNGCRIRWAPLTADGLLDLLEFEKLLTNRTKLVAITAVSNVLGTINPIGEIVRLAHAVGAKVLVDAAQAVPHEPINVQAWDCDFLAFSGHKMAGPSGVGCLYGKESLLEQMPPFLGGGSMIQTVTLEGFVPASLPYKFEAGTPPIVPAIGLGAAVEYLQKIGLTRIAAHERLLTERAHQILADIPGLRFLGPAPQHKAGICSFVVDGVHADDLAKTLDFQGIAVRAGHHCAMPLHAHLGVAASCRASFYLYNTLAEIDFFAAEVRRSITALRRL